MALLESGPEPETQGCLRRRPIRHTQRSVAATRTVVVPMAALLPSTMASTSQKLGEHQRKGVDACGPSRPAACQFSLCD